VSREDRDSTTNTHITQTISHAQYDGSAQKKQADIDENDNNAPPDRDNNESAGDVLQRLMRQATYSFISEDDTEHSPTGGSQPEATPDNDDTDLEENNDDPGATSQRPRSRNTGYPRDIVITCDPANDNVRQVTKTSNSKKNDDGTQRAMFRGVERRHRVARFFIGGINKDCNETMMKQYLTDNGVPVTSLRLNSHPYRRSAWAQLNVPYQHRSTVNDPKFWPDNISVRKWIPKSKQQQNQW